MIDIEEQRRLWEQAKRPPKQLPKCSMCAKPVKEGEDQRILMNCFHTVHLSCFRQKALDQLKKCGEVSCSLCSVTVETREWRQHLTPDQLQDYEDY